MKKRIVSLLLIVALSVSIAPGWIRGETVYAADKKLTISTVKSAALTVSDDYTKIQNKLALAKVKYTQSVKKLKLKEKNQRSFRWSALLSFKLPESPNLTDESSYNYEPLELQSEIDQQEHKLNDSVYGIYETVELQFVEAYRLQEKISYNEKRLTTANKTLKKNKAKLLLGEASQSDIDSMESKISTLETTIASDERSLEAALDKLGTQTGLDLNSGYTLSSPFVDADMEREDLDTLIETSLDRSDTYYQAQQTSANALLELNTNYDLMKNQYGASKMSMIDSYINQAKNGETINSSAFKQRYNELLNAVDQPWTGSFNILFISIPKEWIKGEIDGVRYVEDEPYALYESALEYQSALAEETATKNEITQSVKDSFENYISAKNACKTAKQSIKDKKKELTKDSYLNASNKMTYEEYAEVQEEYEELQVDYLQAQADYAGILYSFDRLTCGKVSEYMTGDGVELSTSSGGNSYVVEDDGDGIYYYLRSLVSGTIFEVGLTKTEDLDTDVDSFELWIDNVQVGERTSLDGTIRHLTFDTQEAGKVVIRLYSGDDFVDDCEIDPTVYSGKLSITNYTIKKRNSKESVASYTMTKNSSGTVQLSISPKEEEIASYVVKTSDGQALVSNKKISIDKSFKYLSAANNSLEDLLVSFYDSDGEHLYDGSFDTSDQMIYKVTEDKDQ